MRSAIVISVAVISGLLTVAPGLSSAEPFHRHPAVAALPELGRIDDGPTEIIVRGQLNPRRARRMVRLARAVYADVNRRFVNPDNDAERHPVDLCLFESSQAYNEFVIDVFGEGDHSSMGFYMPSKRTIVANLARSVGNLRHELVHPLVGDDFPKIPAWLNEGLGSLYGTSKSARGGFRFLVNYRLRDLHAADRRGELPTLDDIARSSHRVVRGDAAMTYYATARYLLLYLDQRGQLGRFYRDMRAEPLTAAKQRVLLEKYVDYDQFVTWARGLRYKRSRK